MEKLRSTKLVLLMGFALSLTLGACRGKQETTTATSYDTPSEMAQNVGDAMSGLDESAGSSGSFAMNNELKGALQTLQAYTPRSWPETIFSKLTLIDQAQAASCFGNGFSTCSSGVITRTFGACTMGGATFDGTVTLQFSNSSCLMSSDNTDTVKRQPNYTVTNAAGYTLTVSKQNTDGQMLTKTGGSGTSKSFSLTNDGIRRTLSANGQNIFDVTTFIAPNSGTPVTVTGSGRTRTLTGGSIVLINNLTLETCTLVPSAVAWSGTCTCATSGTWSGTCSTRGSYSLTLTGCGTADLTVAGETTQVTLNRCSGS
jgi:TonB dependent receptor